MSFVSFNVMKKEITSEDRVKIIEITKIIENFLDDLYTLESEKIDYQTLLNFVMSINSEYNNYIHLKVSDKIAIPHISIMKQKLLRKQEEIKQKI